MIDQVPSTCSSARGSAIWDGVLALRGIRHALPGSLDDPENDTHWEVECETLITSTPGARVLASMMQRDEHPYPRRKRTHPTLHVHKT